MAKTSMIRARIEPSLKEEAESVLDQLGMSPTDAITVFYRQIALQRGLPFEVKLPNRTTRRAMRDAELGRDLIDVEGLEDLKRMYE